MYKLKETKQLTATPTVMNDKINLQIATVVFGFSRQSQMNQGVSQEPKLDHKRWSRTRLLWA